MTNKNFELAMVIKARDEASGTLGKTGGAVRELGLAFAAVSAAAVAASVVAGNAFAEFEQGLLNIQAASDGTRQDLEAFKTAALEAASSTRFNPEETVSALYDLSSAGLKAADAIATLNPILTLAAATNASLGRTSENVTMVMGQFGIGAERASDIADTLTASISASTLNADRIAVAFRNSGATAHAMGQSFEATTAALGVLANSFNSGEAAGTGLKSLFGELNQKADQLGIQMRTASGKVKPLVEIIESMERAGWNADKAVSQFGADAGPTLAILLSSGADALREMETKVQANGQAARAAAIQNSGLKAAMTGLSGAFETLTLKMGEAVSAGQKLAAEQLTWLINLPQLEAAAKSVGGTVGSMGQYVVPVLVKIGDAGIWLHNQIKMLGQTPAFKWLGHAVEWIGFVFSETYKNISSISENYGGIFDILAEGFRDTASFIVRSILEITTHMIGWDTTGNQAASGLTATYLRIRAALFDLKQGATSVFASIGGALRENGITTESIGKGIAATFRWILGVVGDLWGGTRAAFSGIDATLQGNGVTTKSVVTSIVSAFGWIKESIADLKPSFKEWAGAAVPAFHAVRQVAEILWEGVRDAFGKIVGELKKMGLVSDDSFGATQKGILKILSSLNVFSPEKLIGMTGELKKMGMTSGDVSDWIVKSFKKISKDIEETYTEWTEIAKETYSAWSAIAKDMYVGFKALIEWVREMEPAFKLLGGFVLIAGLLVKEIIEFFNAVAKLFTIVGTGIGATVGAIVMSFDRIGPAFGRVYDGVAAIANKIADKFDWLMNQVRRAVNWIVNAWASVSGGGATIQNNGDGGGQAASGDAVSTLLNDYTSPSPETFYRGYATGTSGIPSDGLYYLHRGERVVSGSNSNTSFGDFNLNITGGNGMPGFSRDDWRRLVRTVIAPELAYLGGR
ncbi:MAG: phage tail tape measure protein [Magnetococcales bacterium]|nr:phage tail tape measure protein [Magnetococcales bacterium]